MKVLIVDDEEGVRRSLAYIAALRGWKTFAHDQYADCVALIREHGIDVLVTDYRMPEISGLDLIEKLRNAGIGIPVLIVSANVRSMDLQRVERLGVFKTLDKPPDVRELQEALAEAFTNGKSTQL